MEYHNLPLQTEKISKPEIRKAISFFQALEQSPYCQFVTCEKIIRPWPDSQNSVFSIDDEIIIFDSEIEIPQYPIKNVNREERIAIIFYKSDKSIPSVFALRKNFPEVVHTNMFFQSFPISLCIYDIPYDELKISWSSATFIEDIRTWLKKTSMDELHQDGQPLEPLTLFNLGDIILPYDIQKDELLYLQFSKGVNNDIQIIASRNKQTNQFNAKVLIYEGTPLNHGILKFTPESIGALSSFVEKANIKLREDLIEKLKEYKKSNELNSRLLIVLILPKKKNEHATDIHKEIQVYLTVDTVKEIGSKIGFWDEFKGELAELKLFSPNISEFNFDNISIGALKPHSSFNKNMARLLNGMDEAKVDLNLFAVGLGALGSQIFMNLARSGFGKWTLIDNDVFLPHNLARHALDGSHIASSKVESLSDVANRMISDPTFALPVVANIVNAQGEKNEVLFQQLSNCDVILDFSASISVPRYLTNKDNYKSKRVLSAFLNPTGTYQVILYEDRAKSIKIDYLEMLLYRELYSNPYLTDYFSHDATKVRYSNSCRDKSNRIPQENIAIHSASTSTFIKNEIEKNTAQAIVLKYEPSLLSLKKIEIPISNVQFLNVSGWKIYFDRLFIEKVKEIRKSKLPNETGGILIGSWDVEYKSIYVVDTIVPKDNREYPTFFYRGKDGLKEQLTAIYKLTAGAIRYIGEWHSHPENCSTNPSSDDLKLLSWLTENMSIDNLPAIMFIIGDKEDLRICFGSNIEA